jgi:hypothetical protein
MNAEYYRGRTGFLSGREFNQMDRRGFATIGPVDFLIGKKYDDYAIGCLHALRPSWIRVIEHGRGTPMDHREWRVTVWLFADGTIKDIEQ